MWFFHVFSSPQSVATPTSCPKNRETHIVQFCFLEPFVTFQNYVFFIKDSKRLISFRDLPFLLAKCFSVFLSLVFILYTYLVQKIARKECLLHQNSSNFVSLLPALLASLYAMWANSSKSSQPHENDLAAVSRLADSWNLLTGGAWQCHHSSVGPNHLNPHQ